MKSPIRVAVTGAAGQIGYSLLFRIASGSMFGADQPVILHLIEVEPALPALGGVVMELQDCAFPLLKGVVPTSSLDEGFKGVNWALLVGSVPRKAGMERKDLLGINGKIFTGQGQAIAKHAAKDVRILVVGNPCNTNCLIAMNNAPSVPSDRWFAMTMLDQNRAVTQIAMKAGAETTAVTNLAIWGNHSSTMYPDFYNAKVGGNAAIDAISDEGWFKETFLPTVQQRGAAIIKARGLSSAASAANAVVDTVRNLTHPDPGGRLVQRRGVLRRILRDREGPHFLLPDPQRRVEVADRPGPEADRLLQGEDHRHRDRAEGGEGAGRRSPSEIGASEPGLQRRCEAQGVLHVGALHGEVPHLAAGPRHRLAVEVQLRRRLGEDGGPVGLARHRARRAWPTRRRGC